MLLIPVSARLSFSSSVRSAPAEFSTSSCISRSVFIASAYLLLLSSIIFHLDGCISVGTCRDTTPNTSQILLATIYGYITTLAESKVMSVRRDYLIQTQLTYNRVTYDLIHVYITSAIVSIQSTAPEDSGLVGL